MFKLNENACRVVVSDTSATFNEMDNALGAGLRMAADMVETFKGSNLPVAQSQRLYEMMGSGMASLLKGRSEFVSVTSRLLAIAAKSNVPEVSYGCPWAQASEAETMSAELTPQAS